MEDGRQETEESKISALICGICGWFIGNWSLDIGHCFAERSFMGRLGHWKIIQEKEDRSPKTKELKKEKYLL